MDAQSIIDKAMDPTERGNANQLYNPETVACSVAGAIMAASPDIPLEVLTAHNEGVLHYHDLGMWNRPFCRSWDMRPIFKFGLSPTGDSRTIVAGPAKHAHVAIAHLTKVLSISQTLHSGGQGALYGTVFLAPYMAGKSYAEIYQLMQFLVYELNQMPVARGGQVVFSSLNLTPVCPTVLRDVPATAFGKTLERTYGSYDSEINMMYKALMDIMVQGDAHGKYFPFPKMEVLLTPDTVDRADLQEDFELACLVAIKTGNVYFDIEGFNTDAPVGVGCTQCCAYTFEADETSPDYEVERLAKGGYSFRLGGLQAITLNLPRTSWNYGETQKDFLKELYSLMDLCFKAFNHKRNWLREHAALFPFLTQTLEGQSLWKLEAMVGEVAFVGLYEAAKHLTETFLPGQSWEDAAQYILSRMQEYCQMHNQYYPQDVKAVLARAPAEEVAGRFARLDATMGVAISDGRYYSNGFQAFSEDLTVLDTVRIESKLWPYVNGGSITQIYLKESNPNAQALWRFTRNVAKTSNIKYLVYNISYAICEKCFAKTSQLVTECSCGSKDLTWIARVTGYMSVAAVIRNGEIIRQWNVGKWHEFGDRPQQSINKVLEAYK